MDERYKQSLRVTEMNCRTGCAILRGTNVLKTPASAAAFMSVTSWVNYKRGMAIFAICPRINIRTSVVTVYT